jgi:hypothetical protein
MTRSLTVLVFTAAGALIALGGLLPAAAAASSPSPRGAVTGIRADVTCHDPCDDPFQLKAFVSGSGVAGLVVKFTVKGHTYKARTSSRGYAHYHLDVNPTDYPQGVVVAVKASVSHSGTTRSAATWFKPNYE